MAQITPFPAATISIPDDAWEDNSCDYPQGSRLYASLSLNGLMLHLDAREVTWDHTGSVPTQTFVAYPDDVDRLSEALGGDGPWSTLTIRGREYAVFASPYC